MGGFRNFLDLKWIFSNKWSVFEIVEPTKETVLVTDNVLSHPDEKAQSSGDIIVIFLFPDVT